jgi:hypothetical protein
MPGITPLGPAPRRTLAPIKSESAICCEPKPASACGCGSAQASCCAEPSAAEPLELQATPYTTTARLGWRERWDHIAARWGIRRGEHRVEPGLYALGQPTPDAPVCVTANYSLSFDAVRAALAGHSAYVLVLDTKGINVWCAAGKGTFGTDELVRRVRAAGLERYVDHRTLILPQLGASGVAAHEVRRQTGFKVVYGPVRAEDLAAFLGAGQATPEQRRVTFTLAERAVLIPIELVHSALPLAAAMVVLYLLAGAWGASGAVVAALAGVLLFPLLLPWLPTHDFASKGLILGFVLALPIAWGAWNAGASAVGWQRVAPALGLLLAMPPVTAYLSMNFTGSTPLTSPSWVRREMFRYLRWMAGLAGVGALLIISAAVSRRIGG